MHQYRFTLDGNDVQPISLGNFSRVLDISDGRTRRVEYSGTLQFCDEAYDTVVGTLFGLTVIEACTEHTISIDYRENPHDSWASFGDAVIDLNSVELDNESKTVQFSINATNNIKKIDENGSTEFTIDRSEGELLTMFEYESGTEYVEQRRFFKVSTVLDKLFEKMGAGSTLDSDIFTTQYLPKIETLTLQALNAGDVYEVRIGVFSQLSANAVLTVPAGGYTAIEAAEEIEKMILYNLHSNEQTGLKTAYGFCVSRSNEVITITRPIGIPATSVVLNSFPLLPNPVVTTQNFQFGLQDLYISAKGMRDTDLTISFNQLWAYLYTRFNLGMAATSATTIEIDDLKDMLDGTTPASVSFDNVLDFTRKLDTTLMKETAQIGSKFKVSSYDKSQEDWVWADPVNDHIFIGKTTDQNITASPTAIAFNDETFPYSDNGGRWATNIYTASRALNTQFRLIINFVPNTAGSITGNTIEVVINGSTVAQTINLDSWTQYAPVGGLVHIDTTTDILCLDATDTVKFDLKNAVGGWDVDIVVTNGITPTSLTSIIQPSCETAPEVDEEELEIDGLIADFIDFNPACTGQIDLQTETSFYDGFGYAISQHIQALNDYESNYFVIMKDNSLAEAKKFQTCYYYPADPDCDCQDDRIFSKFFYNIPFQYHYSAYLNARTLPSRLDVAHYLREVEYDGTTYTFTETVSKDGSFVALIKDLEVIKFDECLSPSELKLIESEFNVGFDMDIGQPLLVDSRYKKIEFELATGNTRFELRGQRF